MAIGTSMVAQSYYIFFFVLHMGGVWQTTALRQQQSGAGVTSFVPVARPNKFSIGHRLAAAERGSAVETPPQQEPSTAATQQDDDKPLWQDEEFWKGLLVGPYGPNGDKPFWQDADFWKQALEPPTQNELDELQALSQRMAELARDDIIPEIVGQWRKRRGERLEKFPELPNLPLFPPPPSREEVEIWRTELGKAPLLPKLPFLGGSNDTTDENANPQDASTSLTEVEAEPELIRYADGRVSLAGQYKITATEPPRQTTPPFWQDVKWWEKTLAATK
jgi:hypothetical protein